VSAQDPLKDHVGGRNIEHGIIYRVPNRFGNANSALVCHDGFTGLLPPGVYFDPTTGGFTIMFWINILSLRNGWPTVLSFESNYMVFGFYAFTSRLFIQSISYGITYQYYTKTAVAFETWTHVAICVDGTEVKAYFNGVSQEFDSEEGTNIGNNFKEGTNICPYFCHFRRFDNNCLQSKAQ